MTKFTIVAAFLLAMAAGGTVFGQDNRLIAPELGKPAPGHLLDQDYLAPTGATVPQPGVPQGSGPTALDRKIEQENNRLDNSICKGC